MPEFKNYKDKAKELMATSSFVRFKKYSYILLKILLYPVFFLLFLLLGILFFHLFIYVPLNAIAIKLFDTNIAIAELGKIFPACDYVHTLLLAFLLSASFYSVFCIIFRRDLLEGKWMRYFALLSAILNFILSAVVIAISCLENQNSIECSWLNTYFQWFNIWWKQPLTVITSLLISYICLSVYSEKLCPTLPKNAKNWFLKLRLIAFYILINSYFALVIAFSNMWHGMCPCVGSYSTSHYKGYSAMNVSHTMGVYGLVSNYFIKCEPPANCEFGDRLY